MTTHLRDDARIPVQLKLSAALVGLRRPPARDGHDGDADTREESGMSNDRITARAVGALFIIASATAITGGVLMLPIDGVDALALAPAQAGRVITGGLLETVLAFSVIAIATLLFPVLRRHDEGLALSYAGIRVVEGVLLLAATLTGLVVLALSLEVGTGAAGAATVAEALRLAREWTYLVGSMLVFGTSAVLLNVLLLRARLVPIWLGLWGLAGGILVLARVVAQLYGQELSIPTQALLTAPIGLQEMVFAVWLIAKGFSTGVREEVAATAAPSV